MIVSLRSSHQVDVLERAVDNYLVDTRTYLQCNYYVDKIIIPTASSLSYGYDYILDINLVYLSKSSLILSSSRNSLQDF